MELNILLLKNTGKVALLEEEIKIKDRSFRGKYGIKYTYPFDYINDWKVNIFNTHFINKEEFFLKNGETVILKGVIAAGSFYVIEINGFNILNYVKEIQSFQVKEIKQIQFLVIFIYILYLYFLLFLIPFQE